MRLHYIKASPSQNMTAFITDYVCPSKYVQIANLLMDYEYLHVEQVGFIVEPMDKNALLRIEMSGGEFCGNGLLAAAAYCKYRGWSKHKEFALEISGADRPLGCYVKQIGKYLYEAKAEMPQPRSVQDITLHVNSELVQGTIVELDGITHFVTNYWPNESDYTQILDVLTKKLSDKAIGIIPYNFIREQVYEIAPFIYVTETGSKVFERSCGSGTLALGLHLANKKSNYNKVHQPGGIITVDIAKKNYISTNVRLTSEGYVTLDL